MSLSACTQALVKKPMKPSFEPCFFSNTSLYCARIAMMWVMSTSLKVVSIAAVFCASLSRRAMVWRSRLRRRTLLLQLRLFRTGIDGFRPFGLLIRPRGGHPGAFLDGAEQRPDGDGVAVLGGNIGEDAGSGRRHFDRDLVGLELHHR